MVRLQALEDFTLPNGMRVRGGQVFFVPDALGAELLKSGKFKLREQPGPRETKQGQPIFGSTPPFPAPVRGQWWQVPAPPSPAKAFEPGLYEDRDNFVRDQVTVGTGFYWGDWPWWWWFGGGPDTTPPAPVTPTPSAATRAPVLDLDDIKMHLRIEPGVTVEDDYVMSLEMAARLHAENYLRYQIDSGCGENIKQALLFLIGHFYRNREAVTLGTLMRSDPMVLAFNALLFPERDFPVY